MCVMVFLGTSCLLSFLWTFCVILLFVMLLKKNNCSIWMFCSLKSRALLWMHKCVSASLSKRQSPFVPTASHILGHTAASWPQLHGTQGKKREKQGSVGGHPPPVRELHIKWNLICNNAVSISLFDQNSHVCVRYPLYSCDLHVHAVQNKRGSVPNQLLLVRTTLTITERGGGWRRGSAAGISSWGQTRKHESYEKGCRIWWQCWKKKRIKETWVELKTACRYKEKVLNVMWMIWGWINCHSLKDDAFKPVLKCIYS